MKDRKIQDGEQKIVELIDELLQDENHFNYSRVKKKIIEEKEQENTATNDGKERYPRYNLYRYALSLCIISILLLATCVTICEKDKISFILDNTLSTSIMDRTSVEYLNERNNISSKINDIYTLLKQKQNNNYLEISITKDNQPNYKVAYLQKNLINKINHFFHVNNIEDTQEYQQYLLNVKPYKIISYPNDYYLKYNYYLYLKNISTDKAAHNIKWIDYNDKDNIEYSLDNYVFVYMVSINENVKALDLKTNSILNKDIRLIEPVEVNYNSSTKKFDISNNTNNDKMYLYNIDNLNQDIVYIHQTDLEINSVKIENINGIKSVYGIVSSCYYKYLECPEILIDIKKQEMERISFFINKLKEYELYEEKINYDISDMYAIYKYYNYDDVKEYIY